MVAAAGTSNTHDVRGGRDERREQGGKQDLKKERGEQEKGEKYEGKIKMMR